MAKLSKETKIEIDATPVSVTTHDSDVAYRGIASLYDTARDRYYVYNPEVEDFSWIPRSFLCF